MMILFYVCALLTWACALAAPTSTSVDLLMPEVQPQKVSKVGKRHFTFDVQPSAKVTSGRNTIHQSNHLSKSDSLFIKKKKTQKNTTTTTKQKTVYNTRYFVSRGLGKKTKTNKATNKTKENNNNRKLNNLLKQGEREREREREGERGRGREREREREREKLKKMGKQNCCWQAEHTRLHSDPHQV